MKLGASSNKLRAWANQNGLTIVLSAVFLIATFSLVYLNFSINEDDGDWDAFKEQHHCKLQTNQYGVQQSNWLCDDGKVYYRWRQQR